MRTGVMFTVLALVATGPGVAQADCKFAASRDGEADLAGVAKVVIATGPGDLKVVASADARRIVARGSACASTQELLDNLHLEVRREGDTVFIDAGLANSRNMITVGNTYAHINVGIALPPDLPVELRDSSGDISVTGVAALTLDDSSGDIEVQDVGSVEIKDSSGETSVTRARGDVTVTFDGSGDIVIRDVGGNAEVGSDGSGDIRISDVKGSVVVGNDGSGEIVVENVGGDFTVGNDGSGGIIHRGVTGKVTVPER